MTEGIKRRDFLKVLGVSGAGVGLSGCSTGEVEKLLPYVVPPEDITPGVATWYTTVCNECSAQCGMWVRTREGRAVKVEGNPNHPVSGGALCGRGHSSIQGLYNPDRIAAPLLREGSEFRQITWEEAEAMLAQRLQGAAGNVLLFTGQMGPTEVDLATRFLSVVGGEHVQYDALSDPPLQEATRIAFGRDVIPRYDFERAEFILSFGADFLETWVSPVEYQRGFARAASLHDGHKGRFVFVGPRLSLTGQNADEWLPIPAGTEAAVALGMASAIAASGGNAGPYAAILDEYTPEIAAQVSGLEADAIREMASAFAEASSVAVGPGQAGHHQGATAANLAVHILNAVAGNVGQTVQLDSPVLSAASPSYGAGVEAAIQGMASGNVGVAIGPLRSTPFPRARTSRTPSRGSRSRSPLPPSPTRPRRWRTWSCRIATFSRPGATACPVQAFSPCSSPPCSRCPTSTAEPSGTSSCRWRPRWGAPSVPRPSTTTWWLAGRSFTVGPARASTSRHGGRPP
jgi:hypothetical protein